jgi:hypothetical protein
MKCPHCTVSVHPGLNPTALIQEARGTVWQAASMLCPSCGNAIIQLWRFTNPTSGSPDLTFIAWPRSATRPVPNEVDDRLANDYREAAAILGVSAKASAALSRRCLQDVLREKARVKHSDLYNEIQEVIDSGKVPSWLAENLDAVRVVGNFAAHPIKSTNTGEVVDVEPGEAEFLLDVLDGVFDFYFVQPEKASKQRAALNAKLQEAGKPELQDLM